jgi:predicted CoA-binding protein
MNTKAGIDSFLTPKKLALIGLSRDPKKFSRAAYKELSTKGFEIYPINPNVEEIDGIKCYKEVSGLPADIKHALIITPKDQTLSAVEQAIGHGITNIWLQQGSETPESIDFAEKQDINLISKTCILMHCQPVKGVHGFHRFIMKVFARLPK